MTVHQVLVTYSGTAFFLAALFTLGVWKMLGPSDHDRITLGWPIRWALFSLAMTMAVRGVTLIFPGRLVAVEYMSPVIPPFASALLAVAFLTAELMQRYRLPPPLMDRMVRAWAAFQERGPSALAEMAMIGGVAEAGDAAEAEAKPVRLASPRLRKVVLLLCVAGLLTILVCFWTASAATPA